jgi:hypothetical protein
MGLISRREYHIIGVNNNDLNRYVSEIKTYFNERKTPDDYIIKVYKDAVACCGYYPLGFFVEIEGPEKQSIEDIDLRAFAKIMEICQRDRIEYHEVNPMEILNVNNEGD